jgi:mycofactocin precursor
MANETDTLPLSEPTQQAVQGNTDRTEDLTEDVLVEEISIDGMCGVY